MKPRLVIVILCLRVYMINVLSIGTVTEKDIKLKGGQVPLETCITIATFTMI